MPPLITRAPARWSLGSLSPDDRALVLGTLEHIAGILQGDHSIHNPCLEGDRGLLRLPRILPVGRRYEWGFDSWADAQEKYKAPRRPLPTLRKCKAQMDGFNDMLRGLISLLSTTYKGK